MKKAFRAPQDRAQYVVYFLKLQDGFYYVGITRNLERRLKEHLSGKGCVVTHAHRPTKLVARWNIGVVSYNEAQIVEDEFTVALMRSYGNKVRGGCWCRTKEKTSRIIKETTIPDPRLWFEGDYTERVLGSERLVERKMRTKRKSKMKGMSRAQKVQFVCSGKRR